MKTTSVALSTLLTIALTMPVFGQDIQTDTTSTDLKTHDISSLKGTPTTDTTSTDLKTHDMSNMMGNQTADTTKPDMKHHDMSGMMGKPTADATVEGLHLKIWLMTQAQHKDMMKGKKHDGMEMNKATTDSMMAGTHHIMLEATDATTGKEITDASAKVLMVSPSKKNSSVDLRHMMSHFGGALTLDEKGEYRFTVNVNVGGVSKTTQFQYAVK